MLKLVLNVPNNFDAESFCHVVTALVNSGKEHYDRTDYDLGDCCKWRKDYSTKIWHEYEIDAKLIDFETIETICKLQKLCPLVDAYFENSEDSTATPKKAVPEVPDEFYADVYYELFKRGGVKQVRHSA